LDWNRVNNELSEAILEADRLEAFLQALGCEAQSQRGGGYRGPCPVHRGDGPNFQLQTHGHDLPIYWSCFSHHCEETYRPSLLGLVRGVLSEGGEKKVHLGQALSFLKAFLGGRSLRARRPTPGPARLEPEPAPRLLSLSRARVRAALEVPSPYFVARGYSPAVLDALDVGHSPKLNRSVVPLYDESGGTCVGFVERSEKPRCDKCKWCHDGQECGLKEPRWKFPKGTFLYNHAAARGSASPFFVVVEGPGDVFSLAAAGYPAVALLGTAVSDVQVQKLAALKKGLVIAFDNDQAGRENAENVRSCFPTEVDAYVRFPPEEFEDVGAMPPEAVKAWLTHVAEDRDEGEEVLGDHSPWVEWKTGRVVYRRPAWNTPCDGDSAPPGSGPAARQERGQISPGPYPVVAARELR
jgi:hypothetical protein